MLNIPEEIKEIFRSNSEKKKFKLTFYAEPLDALYPYETLFPEESLFPSENEEVWVEIDDSRIESESLVITESLSEAEDLEFGSCESAMMEIVVADVIENLTGKEFSLTVETGGYQMALGIYTVDSYVRQSDRRKRKITAYDRMRKFNEDVSGWYNELDFPMTIKSLRDSLCDYVGVRQNSSSLPFDALQISKTIDPKELSGLDVLKAICQINGCFGHIDKTGELKYVRLQQTGLYPSEDLYPEDSLFPAESGGDGREVEIVERYRQPMEYEDYLVEGITGLTIREQEGDVGASVGTDENAYTIEGNFLLYGKNSSELLEIANGILPLISGKVYRPAKVKCNAMPWLEVGDAMRIFTRDDIVETFCMNRTTSGCQAMTDEIQSSGAKKRESAFGIGKQIIQLEGKAAVITKSVEEVSVRVTDLKNYTESQFKITADQIRAEVTRATKAEGELSGRITVEAGRITSEVTRATKAEGELGSRITQTATEIRSEVTNTKNNLQSQITQQAEQISLKVSKGDVTKQLNSELTITGNSIALTTGHFTIKSNNLTVDSNGNVTMTGKVTASSGEIGNWTIDSNGLSGDTGGGVRSATITGGHIEGATIDVADGIFQVEDGYANSDAVVRIGDFICSNERGRSIFQSDDEMTGMSGNPAQSRSQYLWAGYRGPGDYAFVVNDENETRVRGSLHVSGNLYLNGTNISGGSSGITGSVKSLKVGYDLDGSYGNDWLEIYPKNFPDTNANPEYEGMDYLYVYLERHYK